MRLLEEMAAFGAGGSSLQYVASGVEFELRVVESGGFLRILNEGILGFGGR